MDEIEINLHDKEETYPNCTVHVLTNTVTGEQSIGWWENPTGRTFEVPDNYPEIYNRRGDYLWGIDDEGPYEVIFDDTCLDEDGTPMLICTEVIDGTESLYYVDASRPLSEFGKSIWLTCEEAMAAWKERYDEHI